MSKLNAQELVIVRDSGKAFGGAHEAIAKVMRDCSVVVTEALGRAGVKPLEDKKAVHPKTKCAVIASFKDEFAAAFVTGYEPYRQIISEVCGHKETLEEITANNWRAYIAKCKDSRPTGKLKTVWEQVGTMLNENGFRTKAAPVNSKKDDKKEGEPKGEGSPESGEVPTEVAKVITLAEMIKASGVDAVVAELVKQFGVNQVLDCLPAIDVEEFVVKMVEANPRDNSQWSKEAELANA